MFHLATSELTHFLTAYGYWAVLFFVAIESSGIPFPGETMLLVAAIYAGTTHRLAIPLVIAAATLGAILGDNIGYWVGREGGYRLLRRYGHYLHIDERRVKLGQYLFRKHGGKVVFFGRFIAVLRAWAAFLAGTNRMPWGSFLLFTIACLVFVCRNEQRLEEEAERAFPGPLDVSSPVSQGDQGQGVSFRREARRD